MGILLLTQETTNFTIKIKLLIQQFISFVLLFFLYYMYWVFVFVIKQYKIPDLYRIREQFKSINANGSFPLIICANHLTYIDSVLLSMSLGSFSYYFFNFKKMAWNFPKTEHMKNNTFYKFICYIGKCVFINLNSSLEEQQQPMQQAAYLLSKEETILIFPEGHRSLTGKVDIKNFTYGVGKLINNFPTARVLCIYLRGKNQQASSNFPAPYEQFYCKLNLLPVDLFQKNNISGLKKTRFISQTIVQTLAQMEEEYFSQYA